MNGDGQPAVPIDPQTPEAIMITFPSPGAEVKGVVKVAAATMLGPKVSSLKCAMPTIRRWAAWSKPLSRPPARPRKCWLKCPFKFRPPRPGRVLGLYAECA